MHRLRTVPAPTAHGASTGAQAVGEPWGHRAWDPADSPGRRRPCYLVDGEHVEVRDVVLVRTLDPRHALLLVNELTDVLVHELPLGVRTRGEGTGHARGF